MHGTITTLTTNWWCTRRLASATTTCSTYN